MRILMAGGGTGGHLYPGLALADALREAEPECRIHFAGTAHGLDDKIIPQAGYDLTCLSVGRGSPLSIKKPLNCFRFIAALYQSYKLIRSFKPDVFVSLGGFAAAAPGLVSVLLGVPIVLLEQNTVPGRVTRLLSRFAKEIHMQFAVAAKYLPATKAALHESGSPVRKEIVRTQYPPVLERNALLVTGGSQGAKRLNELVVAASKKIVEQTGCTLIHVTGSAHEELIKNAYRKLGVNARVIGMTDDMVSLYKQARLTVTRSGAGSITEAQVTATPAIFLPLSTSKDGHQQKNAEAIVHGGGAMILDETVLVPEALAGHVIALWKNSAQLQQWSLTMRGQAKLHAGQTIAESILQLSGKSGQ